MHIRIPSDVLHQGRPHHGVAGLLSFISPRFPYSLKPVPGIRRAFINAPWGAHQGEPPSWKK